MLGVLNLNKPRDWSSRDAVDRVQRLVRPHRAGHAGTLDPLATGVLVVCVGQATRLIQYVQQLDKEYRATFLLGQTSASDDVETPTTELASAIKPTRAEVEAVLPQFTGRIEQTPPAYSAIKQGGQRAYRLARRGEAVQLAPRSVRVDELKMLHYEYPQLDLLVRCGSGVYVRALGRDIARALGTQAVMSALVRTRIGSFRVEEAVDPAALDATLLASRLQPALLAVAAMPRVNLTCEECTQVKFGRLIRPQGVGRKDPSGGAPRQFAALDSSGRLVAILTAADDELFRPAPNFPRPD